VARAEKGNAKLTLKEAVLTFINSLPEQDRVYQRVLLRYPQARHKAVDDAFLELVSLANAPHHDVLREISLKHPDEVFQNELQKFAFDALCELVAPATIESLAA
jgi:hypothetical protein